jgi:hypothetical protein
MAKYDVTHSCGHKQIHSLFGPHKERDRKLDWLATTLCTECYHGKLQEDRDNASRLASDWARGEGLSPLSGTPKQIAWAETLRASMLGDAQTAASAIHANIRDNGRLDEPPVAAAWAAVQDALVWLSQQDRAKFWIDNRELGSVELILLCPYLAEHLETLAGRRGAEILREDQQRAFAESAKKAEAARKKRELDERREADRAELARLFGEGEQLAVKTDHTGERRVYVGGYPAKATYYHTGNRYHAAGSLEIGRRVEDVAERLGVEEAEAERQVTEFCKGLCGFWKEVRIN